MSNILNIPEDKNFCRVYQLPPIADLPKGFCFGGGLPIRTRMVDWFKPVPTELFEDSPMRTWQEVSVSLLEFVKQKQYVKAQYQYFIVTDFGEVLYFIGE